MFNRTIVTKCSNIKFCSRPYNAFLRCSSQFDLAKSYDVVVVGGGHAGTEACAAAARMGARTLLVTHKKSMIGAMSCNPSFGGIGKGHLMKEVDALDGLCSKICDLSGVHYKILNKRKGPAVWGYRAQIDRTLYKKHLHKELFNTPNLTIIENAVEDLILETSASLRLLCCGIVLKNGDEIYSNSVVLTTGTFLRGMINIGLENRPAGRMGDNPAIGLALTLEKLKLKLGRLKTGTPPRLDKNTIDFSVCTKQLPDNPPQPFSYLNEKVWIKPEDQLNCYITFTNQKVNKIVMDSLHLNKHVKEEIVGARYCPSLESKVIKYPERNHQVWLEPEGLNSSLIYPQGISCTMPPPIQQELIRLIPGLEQCEIVQPGYGVEYDYVNPQELYPQLETKKISGLFFAGQINGTTGYEEAAAQGIIAGINAAARCKGLKPLIVNRTEGYIGVLIDDLTTHGTSEPYRMFTFRSEFRLHLRPDNADIRLTRKGYEMGCVSEERFKKYEDLHHKLSYWSHVMKNDYRKSQEWRKLLPDLNSSKNNVERSAFDILGLLPIERPRLQTFLGDESIYKSLIEEEELIRRIQIESHYKCPLKLEEHVLSNVRMNYSLLLPENFDYFDSNLNISTAIKEKLSEYRPRTIAAACSIPGVTSIAILSLLKFVKLKKNTYEEVS